jgi:anaerobic dimethyl sulfoxide reductase subunit A
MEEERIVLSSGAHNCGGRCVVRLHVRGDRIVRISSEGDEGEADPAEAPQLRACARCRAYRERMYHPDRLLRPLRRSGARGEGAFVPISWDEALDRVAADLRRSMERYGPDSILIHYGTGNEGLLAERNWMKRLVGLMGGYLGTYNSYSTACATVSTPFVYGTNETGSSRETWADSKLILLVGFNPADTIHGSNTAYYLKRAKEAGARIVVIDPIFTNTAGALADRWIPIRPTTDNALFDAMAYVIATEGLLDRAFLDRLCLGFDEAHMPPGYTGGLSYESYLLGRAADGIPKSPAWAEPITGVPARVIAELARDFARSKPAALVQGYGPQRHARGEQFHRGGPALAAMTGNIGLSGGWAAGTGYLGDRPSIAQLPRHNPNPASIPVYTWPEAVLGGKGLGPERGVRGVPALRSGVKMILNLAGNCLVNQHTDSGAAARILRDESLVESIVVNDQFLTPSARFADIVLPADCAYERDDLAEPWDWGEYLIFMNKAVDPPGDCRNGYDWISDLADRLGLLPEFTEGLSQELWLRRLVGETAARNPGFPSYEEFRAKGIHRWSRDEPFVAFREQVEEPEGHPFPTPSGKIELFSPALHRMGRPEEIPAIPRYVPAWEGPKDPLRARFPLQCIGHHTKRRAHSIFDESRRMEEIEPQALWINPEDAASRGLAEGEAARVFNDRGACELPLKLTQRMMPGVVSMPQGAWWTPDAEGVDRRGCVNALARYEPTPLAFGNPSHTMLVEVRRAEEGGRA